MESKGPAIFELLCDVKDPKIARRMLISHVKSQLRFYEELSDDTFSSAYHLAGIMATDYVRSLDDTDPIVDILSIEGS